MCNFVCLLSYNTSICSLFLQSSTSDVQAFCSNVATCPMHEAQLLSLSSIRQATANTDQLSALSSTSYIRIQFRWANKENKKTQVHSVISLCVCEHSNFCAWPRAQCRKQAPFCLNKQHFHILKYTKQIIITLLIYFIPSSFIYQIFVWKKLSSVSRLIFPYPHTNKL